MVVDGNVKHRRRWWRLELHCSGCGQDWPCYVVMAARARRWWRWA